MRAVSCDQVEAFGLLVLKQRRDRFPAAYWTFQSGVGPSGMPPQPTTGMSPHASNLAACRANFSTQSYRGVSLGQVISTPWPWMTLFQKSESRDFWLRTWRGFLFRCNAKAASRPAGSAMFRSTGCNR